MRHSLFSIFLFFLFLFYFQTHEQKIFFKQEPTIRVLLMNSTENIQMKFSGKWRAQLSQKEKHIINNDSAFVEIKNGKIFFRTSNYYHSKLLDSVVFKPYDNSSEARITIARVPYGVGWHWEGKEDRIYEGKLTIYPGVNSKLEAILELKIEQYLRGVVPNEISPTAPMEALKAQAIAARCEALKALVDGKYKGDKYDICADVECQVFGGLNKATSTSDKAISETRGEVLIYDNKIIDAYFASNCGGASEYVENIWPNRTNGDPYLIFRYDSINDSIKNFDPQTNPENFIKSSPPVFCNPQYREGLPDWSKTNFRWVRKISLSDYSNNLNKIKEIGKFEKLKILARGKSGRILKVMFIGSIDSLELEGELNIRRTLSPPLRSSNFIFDIANDTICFYGAGWGHGVGMCQSGAIGRALAGQSYDKILRHYYPGTKLIKAYK